MVAAIWNQPDRRTAVLVAFTAGILALPFVAGISHLDEGTLVHTADRIASGEVLYRDVATGVMPGSFYLQAALFLLFGRSLLVGRILMILLFSFASALVFFLARSVSSRGVALAATVSFMAFSVHYWRFPGYSSQAIVLVLLTLAAARAFIDTRRDRWLLLAGLGVGFAILFKQNYGTFLSLGVASGLAAAAPDLRRAVRDVALAAFVAALPIGLTAALFASAGAGADFFRFTVGVPLRVPYTVFTRPWPPLLGQPEARILRDIVFYLPFEELAVDTREWLLAHSWLAVTIVRLTYYAPPLFLIATAILWFRRRARLRHEGTFAAGGLYLGASVFLFLGVFPRVDAHHLFMALAPCYLLFAWLLGSSPPFLARWAAAGASGVALLVSVLAQIAVIAAPYPEEVRDAFLEHPRARVWVERWQAEQIQEQLERIEEHVPSGEPIFVAPSAPMIYFLADRPNPTRYPLILPGALDEEVVRRLDASPVRYALLSDIAFEHFPFQHVAPTVWSYVERNFEPAPGAGWDVAPFAPYLYRRKPGGAAEQEPRDHEWIEAYDLIEPPLSPTPVYQTVSFDHWRNDDPYLVTWQSTYLEPSLVVRAPGGWRKVLLSWEVPADREYRLDFSCAITPWAWAGWIEGQGALVEAWIGSSPETAPPRRVFFEWINPRDVPEDRRWHRTSVDLSSLVETRKAIVTLVVGPAPTFIATDAIVAFTGVRLTTRDSSPSVSPLLPPRMIRLDEGAARRMLAFNEEDLAVFEEATRRYPELGSSHIALSEVAASLGRRDVARAAAEAAVRVGPEYAYFWIRLAEELQQSGELDAAIAAIENALGLEPENPSYYAALAAARLKVTGDMEKVKIPARTAIRFDPDNVWALTLLASAEERSGNHAAALEAASRAVALAPNAAWPRIQLATSLHSSGRTEDALQALGQAAYLPMDAGARAALAGNFLALGRPERARQEALELIEREPDSLEGHTTLGHAEVALRSWESAVLAWQQVVALDPRNSSAFVQLARSLAMSGRMDEARSAIEEARNLARDDPARVREVAIVLDEMGERDDASTLWRFVLARAPEGAMKDEARRRLGVP